MKTMPTAESKVQRLQPRPTDAVHPGPFVTLRQMTASIFDISPECHSRETVEGDFTAYSSKQFVLTEASCPHVRLKRSSEKVTRSRLDHFVIRLLISGSTAGMAGHHPVEAGAGDILFIDLSQTLNLQISERRTQTSDVSLWIPRARVLAAFSEENALHGLVIKGASPAGAMIGSSLLSLRKFIDVMESAEMDALCHGILELIARAIAPTLKTIGLSSAPSQLASFVTIRRYIDRNLTSADLDADAIAKSFGLSRASLYRLFEPVGGIASYIRKVRLNRAFQEVTSVEFSNRRIGQIAFSLGFKNISAFNRLFHKAYGLSPRAVRQQSRERPSGAILAPNTSCEMPFARMLAQIGLP
jgi:AraC-like DNA-binding protein